MDGHDRSDEAPDERREYFRVTDQVLLAYRVLSGETLDAVHGRLDSDETSVFALAAEFFDVRQEMKPLQRATQTESPAIARHVDLVDRKVDRVVQYLLAREIGSTAALEDVDIGAEGMAFMMSSEPPAGALIEVSLGLPSSGTGLRTCGTVRRVDPVDGGYRVALEFHHRRPADRELLVQHTLRIQARELRRKQQAEADGEAD